MKAKTFLLLLAALIAAGIVLACAIGSSWFTNGNFKTWFNSWGQNHTQTEQTEQVEKQVTKATSYKATASQNDGGDKLFELLFQTCDEIGEDLSAPFGD